MTGVIFGVRRTGVCSDGGSCRLLLWFGTGRRRSCSLVINRWLYRLRLDDRLLGDRFWLDHCFGNCLVFCGWKLLNLWYVWYRFWGNYSGFICSNLADLFRFMMCRIEFTCLNFLKVLRIRG